MRKPFIKLILTVLLVNTAFFSLFLFLSMSKIDYDESEFFRFSNIQLSEFIYVESGLICLSKNKYGTIEAYIKSDREIEYYIRFSPLWFRKNIKNNIYPSKDIGRTTENIALGKQRSYNKRFLHYGDRPIVIPGLVLALEIIDYKSEIIIIDTPFYLRSLKDQVDFYNWDKISKEYITVYYPKDTIIDSIDEWAAKRYDAMESICSKFDFSWDKNETIEFYVFNSKESGRRYHLELGFAIPQENRIYTVYNQTIGHEISHIFFYRYLGGLHIESPIFSEGLATYYDMTNRDYDSFSFRILSNNENLNYDLLESNFYEIDDSYILAASYLHFLFINYGKKQVLELVRNNSYENRDYMFYFGDGKDDIAYSWMEYVMSL